MKSYTITVNGNVYDVVVEEGAGAPVAAAAPRAAAPVAPKAAPVAAPRAAPAAPKAAGGAGSIRVEAGAAGKVFKIEAPVGTAVKKGDAVVIIDSDKYYSTDIDRHIMYVASTRALHKLCVLSIDEPSSFIKEIKE